jgi:prepilin-type N-terminal cleavage/methylation domain-containing protein
MQRRQGSPGVTLVELLFCVAVVGILAALAAPSLRAALRASAVRGATFELLAGLQQVRASAISSAHTGTWCLSDPSGQCLAGAGPAASWASFLQDSGHAAPLAGGTLPWDIELRATRPRLTFPPDDLAASTGTLTICDRQGIAPPRTIVLSQSGRVRLADGGVRDCAS